MPNEMTAEEAAEILKLIAIARDPRSTNTELYHTQAIALDWAVNMARRVASGELTPVVHAHWRNQGEEEKATGITGTDNYYCSICDQPNDWETNHCPNCGALMDGKDDSHDD